MTTTRSWPAKAATVAAARRRASPSRPAWSASAPQHPWPGGTTTSHPSAARARAAARLTRPKRARWTQPSSSAAVMRRSPTAGVVRSGRARRSAGRTRGASANGRMPSASGQEIARSSRGRGTTAKMAASRTLPHAPRGARTRRSARVRSIRRS